MDLWYDEVGTTPKPFRPRPLPASLDPATVRVILLKVQSYYSDDETAYYALQDVIERLGL